jgi:hypothetical protein
MEKSEKMSSSAQATLFYGTTFTITELETFFALEPGADNWAEIEDRLEELSFERVVRDCYIDDSDRIIVSAKTIEVDRYQYFRPISIEDLHIDIETG